MKAADVLRFATFSVLAHRLRSILTALGIAVGIAAVVLLTSIGQGVQRLVLTEFTQFGTNLIAITPGKTDPFGVSGASISNVRPLSLDDANALARLSEVTAVVPVLQGNAEAESRNRTRRTAVLGVGTHAPAVWSMRVASGRFLPRDDLDAPRSFAVLGAKLKQELFGNANALGQRLRVGGDRYRVIGVMETKGQFLGFDLDDVVYVPAAKAMELFDRESLMEIDLTYRGGASVENVIKSVKRLLEARHGSEDFTIVTQQQMLDVLGSVLDVLTFAVGALGGISLFVGGVGILTISVRERTAEVGLLRAIGARRRDVLWLFLVEALLLAGAGGIGGIILALVTVVCVSVVVPALPIAPSIEYILLAIAVSGLIGLAAGVFPSRSAARLQPLDALRAE